MATLSNECHISSLLSAFLGRTAASILFTTSASRDGNHSTGGLRLWGETGHRKPVFDPTDDRHLVGYFSELFFFFFRRDIFAGWQRIKWFSERGWWVCLVSRTSILMDTWSHTHSLHIVINYPIYIIYLYIYLYTLYTKVALVVSDLLQDEKNVMIRHYCGLFSGKQRRGKGHAGSSTRGGMSSWMSLVMFLESSMSLQRKPTISHECMCWGCRNPGESGKILFIAILIFCK